VKSHVRGYTLCPGKIIACCNKQYRQQADLYRVKKR
jgi:hypothetical protein